MVSVLAKHKQTKSVINPLALVIRSNIRKRISSLESIHFFPSIFFSRRKCFKVLGFQSIDRGTSSKRSCFTVGNRSDRREQLPWEKHCWRFLPKHEGRSHRFHCILKSQRIPSLSNGDFWRKNRKYSVVMAFASIPFDCISGNKAEDRYIFDCFGFEPL